MTKAELIEALFIVDDKAEVYIQGPAISLKRDDDIEIINVITGDHVAWIVPEG